MSPSADKFGSRSAALQDWEKFILAQGHVLKQAVVECGTCRRTNAVNPAPRGLYE